METFNPESETSIKRALKYKTLKSPRFLNTALKLINSTRKSNHSRCPSSRSSESSVMFEGGSSQEDMAEEDPYYDEVDPDDPYNINKLEDIPHESLKEMYTQVVDELLDIQLEFEEKLADAEEQSHIDLDNQKQELDENHRVKIEEMENDLEKRNAAIAKLSEKLT